MYFFCAGTTYNAAMHVKIKVKSVLLYAAYAVCVLFINFSAGGAPFSLGVCFAMLACGANLFACPVIYALCSIAYIDWIMLLLALWEGAFACAVTFIYRKAHKRIKYEYPAYIALSLAPFVAFSPWNGITSLYFTDNVYIIKAVAAIAVIIFSLFCLKGVYALFYRLCRCRLKSDEIICLTLVFCVAGIGFYNLCGLYAYLAFVCALTVFSVRLFGDPTALAISCVAALPCLFTTFSLSYIALSVLLSAVCLLFRSAGRGAPSAAALACGAIYLYFDGAFTSGAGSAAVNGLMLLCCCMAPAVPSEKYLSSLLERLLVKKKIPEAFESRLRGRTSEKLFKTSEVFREIECAFNSLDEATDDGTIREQTLEDIKNKLCSRCDRREKCKKSGVYGGFERLMHSGTIKGKVSLVDLPAEVTTNCSHPADVIAEMNAALARMRRLSAEAENAKNGRKLLANQAKGIAEVLKSAAVEIAGDARCDGEREKRAAAALAAAGISCTEMRIEGDEGGEIYLTVAGKAGAQTVADVLHSALGRKYILKDKIVYSGDRCCLIYAEPPEFDAAFGVAFAVKEGEKASGDTHSVIKINEHCFLAALCDGMGSGEYAKKVSSTTISLIEAFYRAEMPSATVLETINKLMCFNRDERFTCIDVAAIDLNTLKAGFIKIGSPPGIVIKSNSIRIMESASLPLGILESIHPTVCEEQLDEDDLVVFMSDGITSAFPSTTDLYGYIETLKPLNPQNLAENILAEAKKHSAGVAGDDMTVLAVRVFRAQ